MAPDNSKNGSGASQKIAFVPPERGNKLVSGPGTLKIIQFPETPERQYRSVPNVSRFGLTVATVKGSVELYFITCGPCVDLSKKGVAKPNWDVEA